MVQFSLDKIAEPLSGLFCTTLVRLLGIQVPILGSLCTVDSILTSTWSSYSGTRSWPARPSSWGSWRGPPSPWMRGTSACGSASPARRSGSGWRTCAASSAWAASGSGRGGRSSAPPGRMDLQKRIDLGQVIITSYLVPMHSDCRIG